MRLGYLSEHPLCALCAVRGEVSAAVEIHHIVGQAQDPSRVDDEENLIGLCRGCHRVLTYGPRRKMRVGPDGRLR